jgi:hypothetical protein
MRATFDQKLVAASGFLIFCSIAGCIVGATNAASARSARTEITNVNRVNKGDELTASPIRQTQQKSPPAAADMKTSMQHPPLGCDPAFSPVADPARAGVYKRCAV